MSAPSSTHVGALAASSHHDLVLPSGLQVVLVPQPHVHRAVASLYLRVGSRFETKEDNGISHFLEHMVFRGTRSLASAHDQALAFERLGASLYAATHVDHGVMSVSVPPQNLGGVLSLLGEVTIAPRFTEIEVERGIVREEILEDLDEEGRDVDPDNRSRALLFPDHPLGFTITGAAENLDRFEEPLLRRHHQTHYSAANAVLCVAGRLGDLDVLGKQIERAFDGLPKGKRIAVPSAPAPQKKPRFSFVENVSSQTELRVCFRAVGEKHRIEPAVEMLVRVLDDGMSTRLYERICDRLGLCYDVSAMFEAYEDDGVLDVAAGVAHERAKVVVKEILALLRDLADHGPRQEELDKARDRHLWAAEGMLDDPEATAGFYGLAALADIARAPAARHEEMAAVTREDVRAAAEEVFRAERLSAVAVGMLSDSEQKKIEKALKAF